MTDQQKSENVFQIEDCRNLHVFKTDIPDSIFDMYLTPYEFSLYSKIKRIAGDTGDTGECYASNSCLAKMSHMSVDKVKKVKKILAEKGLIKMQVRKSQDKSFQTTVIQILDC